MSSSSSSVSSSSSSLFESPFAQMNNDYYYYSSSSKPSQVVTTTRTTSTTNLPQLDPPRSEPFSTTTLEDVDFFDSVSDKLNNNHHHHHHHNNNHDDNNNNHQHNNNNQATRNSVSGANVIRSRNLYNSEPLEPSSARAAHAGVAGLGAVHQLPTFSALHRIRSQQQSSSSSSATHSYGARHRSNPGSGRWLPLLMKFILLSPLWALMMWSMTAWSWRNSASSSMSLHSSSPRRRSVGPPAEALGKEAPPRQVAANSSPYRTRATMPVPPDLLVQPPDVDHQLPPPNDPLLQPWPAANLPQVEAAVVRPRPLPLPRSTSSTTTTTTTSSYEAPLLPPPLPLADGAMLVPIPLATSTDSGPLVPPPPEPIADASGATTQAWPVMTAAQSVDLAPAEELGAPVRGATGPSATHAHLRKGHGAAAHSGGVTSAQSSVVLYYHPAQVLTDPHTGQVLSLPAVVYDAAGRPVSLAQQLQHYQQQQQAAPGPIADQHHSVVLVVEPPPRGVFHKENNATIMNATHINITYFHPNVVSTPVHDNRHHEDHEEENEKRKSLSWQTLHWPDRLPGVKGQLLSSSSSSSTAGHTGGTTNSGDAGSNPSILIGTVGTLALLVGAVSARRLRNRAFLSACIENEALEDDVAFDDAYTIHAGGHHSEGGAYHTFGSTTWKGDLEKFDV